MIEQNPFCSCVGQVIRKNLCLIHHDGKVEEMFTLASFVSFRSEGLSTRRETCKVKKI